MPSTRERQGWFCRQLCASLYSSSDRRNLAKNNGQVGSAFPRTWHILQLQQLIEKLLRSFRDREELSKQVTSDH
jgi:hypothetical protein